MVGKQSRHHARNGGEKTRYLPMENFDGSSKTSTLVAEYVLFEIKGAEFTFIDMGMHEKMCRRPLG